jgi:hypothetical protein
VQSGPVASGESTGATASGPVSGGGGSPNPRTRAVIAIAATVTASSSGNAIAIATGGESLVPTGLR